MDGAFNMNVGEEEHVQVVGEEAGGKETTRETKMQMGG
jgi:hypothetical protein